MRRDSLLVFVLLTTICLLAGMVLGITIGKGPQVPRASPTAPVSAATSVLPQDSSAATEQFLQPTPSAGQKAVLFVGVDDVNALQPRLIGCWLVAFSPGINQYYVLGFPPEAHFHLPSLGSDQSLADIYAQDVQQEVGYRFTHDAINSIFPAMNIQATVTLDRADLADLANKVGGIAIGSKLLLGDDLLGAYDTQSFKGASARMDFQHTALLAVFQSLGQQHWSPASLVVYLESLPHAVRPQEAATLTALAANAPPLPSSELVWNVVGDDHAAGAAP